MKKEKESGNIGIYYDNLNGYIPEDKLGQNVLYFPSTSETINISDKINPFTNIVRDNIDLRNMFMSYNVKSTYDLSAEIVGLCSTYMANSIMMNAISIFGDPWNGGSLITILRPYIKEEYEFSNDFYKAYNDFITYATEGVRCLLHNVIRNYFYEKSGIIKVNNDYVVSFINEVVHKVSTTYTDEGQRFIANIITNGSVDMKKLNDYLITLIECSTDPKTGNIGKQFDPAIRVKMLEDDAHAITYLNMALNVGISKISEITEAISYSGLFYIREISEKIDWENCNNRLESKLDY